MSVDEHHEAVECVCSNGFARCRSYAEIRAQLKRQGNPIGSNDLMIAAHARSLDATLVTNNVREFRRVPGLRVENWAV